MATAGGFTVSVWLPLLAKHSACIQGPRCGMRIASVDEAPQPTYVTILLELEDLRTSVHRLEFHVIRLMREAGVTWEAIGDEFGISRQAARQRFGTPRRRRD